MKEFSRNRNMKAHGMWSQWEKRAGLGWLHHQMRKFAKSAHKKVATGFSSVLLRARVCVSAGEFLVPTYPMAMHTHTRTHTHTHTEL